MKPVNVKSGSNISFAPAHERALEVAWEEAPSVEHHSFYRAPLTQDFERGSVIRRMAAVAIPARIENRFNYFCGQYREFGIVDP
jgi:hypothetical protein